eukprot:g5802.t1
MKLHGSKNEKGDWRSAYYRPGDTNMQLHLLGLLDNGNIQMVSTVPGEHGGARKIAKPSPGHDVGFEYPELCLNYRANYGATDQADRLRAMYSCHLFTDRYYRSIFFWVFDTMVNNSYLLAKANGNKYAQHGLLEYLLRLIWNLSDQEGKEKKKDRMQRKKRGQVEFTPIQIETSSLSKRIKLSSGGSNSPSFEAGGHKEIYGKHTTPCCKPYPCLYVLVVTHALI